jgi:glycosyltransferase involved in cell wall biosynthesis
MLRAIRGYETVCEIIISDDGSTDDTPDIIQKWKTIFSPHVPFRVNVNATNGGPVRNIARCLELAQSEYVWVVGDDDDIAVGAIAYVIQSLQANPKITALILNYSIYYAPEGKITCDRYFPVPQETPGEPGQPLLENFFRQTQAANGIGFVTSLIYKTETAQQALQAWPASIQNFEAPGYWTGFCAIQGEAKISQKVWLQYNCGMNSKPIDQKWFGYHYSDLPTMYLKLIETGYDGKLLRQFMLDHFQHSNLRVILGSLRRWPWMTIRVMVPYLRIVAMAFWKNRLAV